MTIVKVLISTFKFSFFHANLRLTSISKFKRTAELNTVVNLHAGSTNRFEGRIDKKKKRTEIFYNCLR